MLLFCLYSALDGTLVPCLGVCFSDYNYHIDGSDCGVGYGTLSCFSTSISLPSSGHFLESSLYHIGPKGTHPSFGHRTGIIPPIYIYPLSETNHLLASVLLEALSTLPALPTDSACYIRTGPSYALVNDRWVSSNSVIFDVCASASRSYCDR